MDKPAAVDMAVEDNPVEDNPVEDNPAVVDKPIAGAAPVAGMTAY